MRFGLLYAVDGVRQASLPTRPSRSLTERDSGSTARHESNPRSGIGLGCPGEGAVIEFELKVPEKLCAKERIIGFWGGRPARQADAEPESTYYALVQMEDPHRRFSEGTLDSHPGFRRAFEAVDVDRVVIGIMEGKGEDGIDEIVENEEGIERLGLYSGRAWDADMPTR